MPFMDMPRGGTGHLAGTAPRVFCTYVLHWVNVVIDDYALHPRDG